MRVAIIHDWLLGMRGGERCLEVLGALFPEADLYTLFYDRCSVSPAISAHNIVASAFDKLPFRRHYYRHLLPFYPLAVRSLEQSLAKAHGEHAYDLVISVSHCAAKNVAVPAGAFHLCYCLTPMRYIWDQYERYFADRPLEPLVRPVARALRHWDSVHAQSVDHFVAISEFVRARIRTVYRRNADVIFPPVATEWITPSAAEEKGEGFLCVSALVPYKNIAAIVEAFNRLGKKLTIVGRGPEGNRLKRLAKRNITFVDYVSDQGLAALYRGSEAMVFAAEEDFGMAPVEMQAAGRPVICLGRGGALETVTADPKNPTGIFFSSLDPEVIVRAVQDFLDRQSEFSVDNCLMQARRFSLEHFVTQFSDLISSLGFAVQKADMSARRLRGS